MDTTEIEGIYDKFLTKSLEALEKLQTDTGMEDEYLATVASNVIVGAMENSVRAFAAMKDSELVDARIDDTVAATKIRNEQHAKDLLIRDQQLLSEQIKNGGVYFAYTYNPDGTVATKTLQAGTTKSIYEVQIEKAIADMEFVKEQKLQLGYSVTYNNRLKVAENYGDMLGNLGLGGLNVSSGMWGVYFNMLNDVYTNYGEVPVNKTISVPAAAALVLTKIV